MKNLFIKLFIYLWKESGIAADMNLLENQIGPQLDLKLRQIEQRATESYDNSLGKIRDMYVGDKVIGILSELSKREKEEVKNIIQNLK